MRRLNLFVLPLLSISIGSCAVPKSFPDIRICTIIDTDDMVTSYGRCARVKDQQDVIRPPLHDMMKGRYMALTPDDYATFMEWVNDHRDEISE